MTQIVNGIFLPDRDTHFVEHVRNNPLIDNKGTYQLDKIVCSMSYCDRFGLAIDIGANVGLWTRLLAKHFKKVIAIEPVLENLQCLSLNANTPNVEIISEAINTFSGLLSLKYTDGVATASVCSYEDRDVEVPCRPLDDFGFEYVDFIKIDVEGFENRVVQSGEKTIRTYRPTIVVEQKKRTIKYDSRKLAAVETLEGWGMTVMCEMAGDFFLTWRH